MNTAFTDNLERTWTVSISVLTLSRIQAALNIQLSEPHHWLELAANPIALCEAVYIACEGQHDIEKEDLAKALGGDSLRRAGEAFLNAAIEFCQTENQRTILKDLIEKGREAEAAGLEMFQARLAAITNEQILEQIGGGDDVYGSWPRSTGPS